MYKYILAVALFCNENYMSIWDWLVWTRWTIPYGF
jgi:hypothetical protein